MNQFYNNRIKAILRPYVIRTPGFFLIVVDIQSRVWGHFLCTYIKNLFLYKKIITTFILVFNSDSIKQLLLTLKTN